MFSILMVYRDIKYQRYIKYFIYYFVYNFVKYQNYDWKIIVFILDKHIFIIDN